MDVLFHSKAWRMISEMKLASRAYIRDEDFTSVMTFLRDTFKITNSYQNWFPDRFENNLGRFEGSRIIDDIRIWEAANSAATSSTRAIVAVANPESPADYFIQIDPAYSFLEQEILKWIEEHCLEKKKGYDKMEKLQIHTVERNPTRESLLSELGYPRGEVYGYIRLRSLDLPIPEIQHPKGYEIRSVRGKSDFINLAAAVRLVFGHGEWFNAEAYKEITRCSFYKQDLDLVAVAPDGTFASFCTFRMDPISRVTNLEPVGTHPKHRRLGLARTLILKGLRRVLKHNPTLLYIGGAADTPAANRLYDSVGYTRRLAEHCWYKEI